MHEASKWSHNKMIERLKGAQAKKTMSTLQPPPESPV